MNLNPLTWFRKEAPPSTATQYDLLSPTGKPKPFQDRDAYKRAESWAWIAAGNNAAGRAAACLRLYAVRGVGEPTPKLYPWRKAVKQNGMDERDTNEMDMLESQGGEALEILEHPFLDLLASVNPWRTQYEHMEETSLQLDCTGNAYWYIEKQSIDGKQIPFQLWLLPSINTTIVPDEKNFIKGYLYGLQGKQIAYRPDEVIHFRLPSLTDQYYGHGRIETAYLSICTFRERDEYEHNMFKNRGVQELLLKYKQGNLTMAQRTEMTRMFDRAMRTNSVKIADGVDFDVEKIAFSPRELLSLNSRQWNQDEILNAFGQTRGLYAESAIRANVDAAIFRWCKFEIDPSLKRIAEKLTEILLPMYDSRLYCEYDPVAQVDSDFTLRQEQADVAGHIRTVNEIRIARGLKPSEDTKADDLFFSTAPAAFIQPGQADGTEQDMPGPGKQTGQMMAGEKVHRDLKGVAVKMEAYP